MKRKLFVITGLVAVALVAYLFAVNGKTNTQTETKTEDIKQLVHDYSVGKKENENASITSQELVVTDKDANESTYSLPEDEFFVSIAPYVENTHPCAVHSLTGCQGEMVNEEFSVYIEDTEGNVILDQTTQSQSNGFVDLWLPRDKTYRVTFTHDGKTAQSEVSTFENDNTCITTMQLNENKSA
ncbi:CueP family metal-binding protein [Aquibacillus rhizosphaerae]|uniref:CueP family metal-binding protein n=1 Tax=Aquibacillus rhizosphaerae TaxID=3051431 RepID=A0ABT7L3Z7_9BACI|nr:CueP family metal-binding protein [Aquibacillus sp. LR5S19]MDL4840596.1 CueP family metal-binding protein [Aquibacillus sp. LR5S19]